MFGSHCHELLSQQATLKARKLAIEEMYNSTLWLYWKVYWSSKNIFQKQCEIGWHQQFSKIYGTITMNYGSVNAIIPGVPNDSLNITPCESGWNNICYRFLPFSKPKSVFFLFPSGIFSNNLTKATLRTDRLNSSIVCWCFILEANKKFLSTSKEILSTGPSYYSILFREWRVEKAVEWVVGSG